MAIAEAAVGVVLGELLKSVLEIRGTIAAYNSTFESIKSTLEELIPIVAGIDELNRKLDNTGPSTKTLWAKISKGKQLIEECEAEMNGGCSCCNKPQNLERLRELDNSLRTFCQVVVPLQHLRLGMQAKNEMDNQFQRVNDRLGNIEKTLGHLNTPEQQQAASSAASTQRQPTSSISPARPSTQTQPTSSVPPARPSTQIQPTSSVPLGMPSTQTQPISSSPPARPSTQTQLTSSIPLGTHSTQTQPTSSVPLVRPSTQMQPTSSVPLARPSMQTQPTSSVPSGMQPTSSIPPARPFAQTQHTSTVPPGMPSTQTQPTSSVSPAKPSTQTQPTQEHIGSHPTKKMGVAAASQVSPLSNPYRPSEPPQVRENIDNRTRPDQSRKVSTRVEDATGTWQPLTPAKTPEHVKEIVKPKVPEQPYPSRTVNLPAESATSSQQPSASSGPYKAKEIPETIKYTAREPVSSNLSDSDDKGVQKDNKVGKTPKEDTIKTTYSVKDSSLPTKTVDMAPKGASSFYPSELPPKSTVDVKGISPVEHGHPTQPNKIVPPTSNTAAFPHPYVLAESANRAQNDDFNRQKRFNPIPKTDPLFDPSPYSQRPTMPPRTLEMKTVLPSDQTINSSPTGRTNAPKSTNITPSLGSSLAFAPPKENDVDNEGAY